MAGWAYRSRGWQRVALSLVTAGAMGNLFDRAARGTVTDFLGLHFGIGTPLCSTLRTYGFRLEHAFFWLLHWPKERKTQLFHNGIYRFYVGRRA
ncbi:signal peptidase II [Ochrobactrum grignonense]|nr:signal peptidase II [Brucella grignonensis]